MLSVFIKILELKHFHKRSSFTLFSKLVSLVVVVSCMVSGVLYKRTSVQAAPDLANYFLAWDLTDAQVQELSKWDVVVVDMENQVRNPEKLKKLRELNPQIVILAYITSQEIRNDAVTGASAMRKKLAEGIKEEWYLYDVSGKKISFWPGTSMLNISDSCPVVDGKKFNTYLAHFVAEDMLSSGLWDGVFFDNTWQDINWLTKDTADLNRDGSSEKDVDERWRAGYHVLFNETNKLIGNKAVVGNAGPGHKEYSSEMNGILIENFPEFGWGYTMQVYNQQTNGSRQPRIIIINSNTKNTGKQNDYREMRYGLASTLMGNGYFSFDFGTNNHTQTWWYDEYNINLGKPLAPPQSINSANPFDGGSVVKREYTSGIALVNPTTKPQLVPLGGEYEKISGIQDKKMNDGLITDKVWVGAQDGLLMLKTFQHIKNTPFKNGSFLRFFKSKGEKARNGLFVFEEGIPGGAHVYLGDLDGDGQDDKVITTGSKVEVVGSSGIHWTDFPFGDKMKGEIHMAVGALEPGELPYIVVSPSQGGELVLYTFKGEKVKRDVFPLGKTFKGGLTLAIGDINQDGRGEIIAGVGRGKLAEVLVYS
jgi:hypothetical protein